MYQHNIDELDDLEQLRIAALQTLHHKKVEAKPPPQSLSHFPDPVSAFPGYTNPRIQLSPRSAAFVESNISILKRRKEGWSRSPSPKYKAAKRKSLSPLSLPTRHPKRASRSPAHIRRSDTYHSHHHRSSSTRHRQRSRERVKHSGGGHRAAATREHRHRSRSKSPAKQSRSPKQAVRNKIISETRDKEEQNQQQQLVERKESRAVDQERKPAPDTKKVPAIVQEEKQLHEEPQDDDNSSDSDSSSSASEEQSEGIDLFASEESESENEGRFKCSSVRSEKEAVKFSSKRKPNLAGTVLPDGDTERYGARGPRRHNNPREKPRNAFKSSFTEIDSGASDRNARRTTGSGRREERGHRDERRDRVRSSVVVSSGRKLCPT